MGKTPEKRASAILRIIAGPAGGQEIDLANPSYTLGRGVEADIAIADELLSRQHLRVYREGANWFIEDLNSTNSTWVENVRLDRAEILRPGAMVRAGDTHFQLRHPKREEADPGLDKTLVACEVHPDSIENLTITDVASTSMKVKAERDKLAAIYNVQRLLNTVLDTSDLYSEILRCIGEVVEADHLYLLICDPDPEHIVPMAGLDGQGRTEDLGNLAISRSIINYVKDKKAGILSVDAPQDERFSGESIYDTSAHSVMCVPMLGQHEFCGMIYAMSTHAVKVYTEDELKLLTAIAQSAGLAIENNRLMTENLRKERMATIGLAAASLSHHVKNIITGLDSSISLLRMGIDGSDRELMDEAWRILSRHHGRLSGLMLDLLNLAREDTLVLERSNVCDAVLEAAELARVQAAEANITLRVADRVSGQPVYAKVDSGGIHRVVLNLLNNAVQAVEERHGDSGAGEIGVDVWFDEEEGAAMIQVRDNGTGVPEAEQEKIFDMFHTGKGARGTGLGLSVSKRLVELHRGVIGVESSPGEGAVFTIRLPALRESAAP